MQSMIGKGRKLQKPLNPQICLYHSTTEKALPHILKYGLDPYAPLRCEDVVRDIIEEEGITEEDKMDEMFSECTASNIRYELDELLGRPSAIYLVKSKNDIVDYEEVIEVPANLIPCQCFEDDYDVENELYDMIQGNYSDFSPTTSQEKIWKKADEVLATVRPLDTKENDYTTEVFCPCKIPRRIIAPINSGNFLPVCPTD